MYCQFEFANEGNAEYGKLVHKCCIQPFQSMKGNLHYIPHNFLFCLLDLYLAKTLLTLYYLICFVCSYVF